MTYQLRHEYQVPIHELTIKHCRESSDPAYVSASVGAGKTLNIAFMCKHVVSKGGKVLVLARQGELIQQNSDDAWAIGVKNSIFSASLNKKSTTFDCVMGTEGTVSNHLLDVFTNWVPDCILIDENHMVAWQDTLKCIEAMEEQKEVINRVLNGDAYTEEFDQIFYNQEYTQYAKIIAHFKRLRPKLRIIGYTGSPYRGVESIKGQFWKKMIYEIGTMQLISLGFLVPPIFGFGDDEHHYDLSEFKLQKEEGAQDFTTKELAAMGRKLTKDVTMTQAIMEQVKAVAANRNGVMITCASKKHCQQVADCLPDGTWCIITDDTTTKSRIDNLRKIKSGELKYVIQIGCLTTGFNAPTLDTSVILRKIGSLTLLIQLIGRVLRQLKPEQEKAGFVKNNALVLDYTDTLECMGDIYDDPIIQQAMLSHKKKNENMIPCPSCETMNSMFARRCVGVDHVGNRCEHFFVFKTCEKCGAKNDTSARECRSCNSVLVDPNTKLTHKAYTDADFKQVKEVAVYAAKNNQSLINIEYHLNTTHFVDGVERPEVAKEMIWHNPQEPWKRGGFYKWLEQHCPLPDQKSKVIKSAGNMAAADMIRRVADWPYEITHRINDKGFSVINRKKFTSCSEVVENNQGQTDEI